MFNVVDTLKCVFVYDLMQDHSSMQKNVSVAVFVRLYSSINQRFPVRCESLTVFGSQKSSVG